MIRSHATRWSLSESHTRRSVLQAVTPFACVLVLVALLPAQVFAQSLSVGSASGLAGTAVDLPVSFSPGATPVVTIQFDLTFPSSLSYVSTTTGAAATAAGKSASGSSISGGVRVLIFGLNQTAIGSGQIAIVRLNIQSAAHSVTIGGLEPSTTYHFRVRSRDAAGNQAVSGDFSFETAPLNAATSATFYYPVRLNPGVGELEGGPQIYTGLAIINLDPSAAALTFTAHDSRGAIVSGAGIANPAHRLLRPREQLPRLDYELFCSGPCDLSPVAYVKIESSVTRIAAFYMTFDGELAVLDGAVAQSGPTRDFVFSEVAEEGFTQISISNPDTQAATLTFELRNADGQVVGSPVSRTIPGNGALTARVPSDLFPNALPTTAMYVRAAADTRVIPFQVFGKEGRYIQFLSGLDVNEGAPTLYCPQYVVGGVWRSTISLVNLDDVADSIALRFYSEEGVRLGFREVPIAAKGKVFISDQDFFVTPGAEATQGYVTVMSRGARLAGSVAFGDPEQEQFAAALPLVPQVSKHQVFSHVAQDDTYFMGLAMINPGAADATVSIELYDYQGALEATATTIIPARGRRSRVLAEYFPHLGGQGRTSGYLRLISNADLAGFALFGTHRLTVLSAIPAQTLKW